MYLKNPFVLVTIPLALAFGLVWFRRKKIHCDSGGQKKSADTNTDVAAKQEEQSSSNQNRTRPDLKHSHSVPIGGCTPVKKSTSPSNNNDSFDFKFGKSAPIDITPHKTSPRSKNSETKPTDADELKSKIQDVEYKTLNSIEEHSFDSVDLPGSVECKGRFSFTSIVKSHEPAVVVKASTMITNKSPQSSFGDASSTVTPTPTPPPKDTKPAKTPKKADKKDMKPESKAIKKDQQLKVNTSNERAVPVSSPPLSLCSNKSHDSGDSGKGSSPPNSEGGQLLSSLVTYDFELAQTHVGFIVGKGGSIVQLIRAKSGATVNILRHPSKKKLKWCNVQGTQEQVDTAIAIIKTKLPRGVDVKRVDMDVYADVSVILPNSTINKDLLQLQLIDGINNDVIVSTIVNAGHLYFQQPLHPSYPALNTLQGCMNQSYSSFEAPVLPNFNIDTVCVGLIDGHWYRLQIIDHQPDSTHCLAKYLDYGGYCYVQTTDLRQIRTDFMSIPFQAIEAHLSDVKPIGKCMRSRKNQSRNKLTDCDHSFFVSD